MGRIVVLCNHPGCRNLVEIGNGCYCLNHKKHIKQIDNRENRHKRGYTDRWYKIRARKLKLVPLCECCEKLNIIKSAKVVHHIDCNQKNNSSKNLMSLCRECHEVYHDRIYHANKLLIIDTINKIGGIFG